MLKMNRLVCALAAAVPFAFACGAAQAGDATPLTPVRTVCPNVDSQLQTMLATGKNWGLVNHASNLDVRFELDGSTVKAVRVGGAGEYERVVRRAVRKLDCVSVGGTKSVALEIQILDPHDGRRNLSHLAEVE